MRRILSIDGGGIKGVFPAAFLAAVEEFSSMPVREYFDLIVGTSTGGIIALGLGLGMTAGEILDLYRELGPTVFAKPRAGLFSRLTKPKYDAEPLRAALEGRFGDRKLGHSCTRHVIPSYNFAKGDIYLYKTAHYDDIHSDYKVPAVDVALHTAAAPLYFPVHRSAKGLPMVDGGVWCNNPVLVAVLEGTEILGWSPEEIRVLSLGCTESPLDCSGDSLPGGLRGWLKKDRLLDLFMSAQSTFATNAARLRLGRDKERLSRITRMVAPKAYALDGVKGIESLEGLGHDAARTGFPQLKEVFFSEKAEAFEPLRKPE